MTASSPQQGRLYLTLIFAASGALLLGALAFQYVGGLAPCSLCIWQRYPHGAVLVVALVGFLIAGRRAQPWLLGLLALILIASAAVAAFHVGVEQGWWKGLASCEQTVDLSKISPAEMRERINQGPPPKCSDVAWSLFGISMAGYNFIISLALAVFAARAAVRVARRRA